MLNDEFIAVQYTVYYGAFQSGSHCLSHYPGTLPWSQICNSFEGQAPIIEIYGYLIFKYTTPYGNRYGWYPAKRALPAMLTHGR